MGAPRGLFLDFPLGHTAGKKHEPILQKKILLAALAAFEGVQTPGEIIEMPFRWSEDESWRAHPMGGGRKTDSPTSSDDDVRTPRVDVPQYQDPGDEEAFQRQHEHGPCGTCVGAE